MVGVMSVERFGFSVRPSRLSFVVSICTVDEVLTILETGSFPSSVGTYNMNHTLCKTG